MCFTNIALPTGDCEALPTRDRITLPMGDREALPTGDRSPLGTFHVRFLFGKRLTVNVFRQRINQLFQGGTDHPLWEIVCFNQMLKGFCQKYRPQPKKVEKNRWGSKLLAGMKPNQKKKGTSPG
ncbi:MAG: hypothetical protein KGR70_16455, partial [Cyanobacteria bacterium REEB494]|nr:hypothetical protein [Cyanobacteria bacterium REEB494]